MSGGEREMLQLQCGALLMTIAWAMSSGSDWSQMGLAAIGVLYCVACGIR